MNNHKCECGSGEIAYPIYDGYGIYLNKACDKCENEILSKYRSDIFDRYDCDECIESDDY